MCLIADHRDDLQYGSVLCHQEQQGGYIDGELPPLHPPPQQPAHYTFPAPFIIIGIKEGDTKVTFQCHFS